MGKDPVEQAGVGVRRAGSVLSVVFSGDWRLRSERPHARATLESAAAAGPVSELKFQADGLEAWDSGLLTFVCAASAWGTEHGVTYCFSGLPKGVQQMLELSQAAPELKHRTQAKDADFFTRVGEGAIQASAGVGVFFDFLGQVLLDLLVFVRGRAQLRWKDFLFLLQSTGPMALMIVSLLSFLMGLIIAFIGVIQLQKFAADIYVADLVGLAVTRELGAVMVGVIMAGRTGAAFAAQIGSMQVNEEVDALTSFGISPMQFLVVPRVIALVVMMPLLCACADFVGILGGMLVAVAISDVSVVQYFNQVEQAVDLNDLLGGLFKSGVFGVIIALAGCYRGLNCGRDAMAVGLSATSAVVTSITWIVIADAVFAVLFHILGI